MILAIDIGNTTITLGLVFGLKVKKTARIETALPRAALENQLKKQLAAWKLANTSLEAVVICSVVPKVLVIVKSFLNRQLKARVYTIGQDIKVPIKNKYKNPKQVGQDRLVGAYAAMRFYGAPTIVIDLGTAITFDVVSSKKEYLGGIIVPGLRLSAESLFKKTALLPLIKIQAPQSVVGRDTKNSILSGLFYGYGAMCSGLIDLIKKEVGKNAKVIVTGGHTALMKKYMGQGIQALDEDLILKGSELIYRKLSPHQEEF